MSQECNCTEMSVKGLKVCMDTSNLEIPSMEEIIALIDERIARAPVGQGINYSTHEQWSGRTWTDGKKIYQKTIPFGNMGLDKRVPHNVPGIDQVVAYEGVGKLWDGRYMSIPQGNNSHYPSTVMLFIDDKDVFMFTNWSSCPGFTDINVTIQYTCTDR